MTSVFNGINIAILFLTFLIRNVISLLNFNYPSAISLINGNVFVVEKKGIFIYDSQLKNIVDSHPFQDEDDEIDSEDSLSKVIIKLKGTYIICLINRKIFFFNQYGNFILETEQLINEENYSYPTLIPMTALNEQNNYYYIISYFIYEDNSYKQKLKLYYINTFYKSNNFVKEKPFNQMEAKAWWGFSTDTYDYHNKGLSCEYMQAENLNEYNYLVCFFIINKDSKLSLSQNYFEISSTEISINKKFPAGLLNEIADVKQIQSVIKENRKYSLVCLLFTSGDLKCYKYRYIYGATSDDVGFVDEFSTNFNCKNVLYSMKINYLADGQTISLSCINQDSLIDAKFFDTDFNPLNSYSQFYQCDSIISIYGHSIIQLGLNYYVISDIICDNYKRCYELLDGELSSIEIITSTQKEEYIIEDEL